MTRDDRQHATAAPAYTAREMMAIAAGRFIKDGDVLFAGTGVAMLAAAVAKRIHAPHAHIFFETGGIGPPLDELPMAVADPRVMAFSNLNAGLVEAFSYVANRRLHTIAFLGAAQIDKYGNMNSTVIGDYLAPTVRFSGSGGACDAGSLASGFIVFMQHGTQKFVEKLDYLTTPGWLEGGDSRHHAGYRRGGPIAVVTNLCVLKFEEDTHEMYLAERYEGVTRGAGAGEHRLPARLLARDGGDSADRRGAADPARRRRSAAPDPRLTEPREPAVATPVCAGAGRERPRPLTNARTPGPDATRRRRRRGSSSRRRRPASAPAGAGARRSRRAGAPPP